MAAGRDAVGVWRADGPATGRTDLLTGFVSKKGRRFKAFLVKTTGGKIGFEFQARAPREKPTEDEKPGRRRTKAA